MKAALLQEKNKNFYKKKYRARKVKKRFKPCHKKGYVFERGTLQTGETVN